MIEKHFLFIKIKILKIIKILIKKIIKMIETQFKNIQQKIKKKYLKK